VADNVAAAANPDLLDLERGRVLLLDPRPSDDAVSIGPRGNLPLDFVDLAHPRTQDEVPASLFTSQIFHRLLAGYFQIDHDADPLDAEAPSEQVHDGDESGHLGGVARPEFAADGPSLLVQDRADHHLLAVRPVNLAVASFAQSFTSLAFEVDRGDVEEDHGEG
jgi:hypothetical protein